MLCVPPCKSISELIRHLNTFVTKDVVLTNPQWSRVARGQLHARGLYLHSVGRMTIGSKSILFHKYEEGYESFSIQGRNCRGRRKVLIGEPVTVPSSGNLDVDAHTLGIRHNKLDELVNGSIGNFKGVTASCLLPSSSLS